MYCETSVTRQLTRGVLAAAAIAGAILLAPHFWPAIGLLAVAVYFMGGCPACWLAGLIQAIENRPKHPSAAEPKRPQT